MRCAKEKAKETMALLSKKLKSLEDQGTDTVAELSAHALQQKETIISLREKLGTSLLEARDLRQEKAQIAQVLQGGPMTLCSFIVLLLPPYLRFSLLVYTLI